MLVYLLPSGVRPKMTEFEHYGGRHLSLSRTQHRSILEEAHRLRAEYLFLTVVWAELKVLSDPGSEDRESLLTLVSQSRRDF